MAGPLPLLAIVELGGYPNFSGLYRRCGYEPEMVATQRKALAALKRGLPRVVVAEYNWQYDFRDRSSNLETLMARLQPHPEVRVILFHLPEHGGRLAQFRRRFRVFEALPLPLDEARLEAALRRALI